MHVPVSSLTWLSKRLTVAYEDQPVRIRARIEMYLLASSADELFVLSLFPIIVLDVHATCRREYQRSIHAQRGVSWPNNSYWVLEFGGIEVMASQQEAAT